MKEFLRDIVDDALIDVREKGNRRLNDAFNDGYNVAADICVGIITKKIDELFSQINSGSFLSEREQFLLSKLKEIKSETEEELRDFWSDNE